MFKKLKDKTREAAEAAKNAAEQTLQRSDSMSSLNSQTSAFSGKCWPFWGIEQPDETIPDKTCLLDGLNHPQESYPKIVNCSWEFVIYELTQIIIISI